MSKKPEEKPKQVASRNIAVAVILILAGVAYLSVFGIQLVSTDKDVYMQGEVVTIRWSNFFLSWNSCREGHDVQIFMKGSNGWEDTNVRQTGPAGCIDGSMSPVFMPGDVCIPMFAVPKIYNGDYIWDMKMLEKTGETSNCGGRELSRPVNSYTSKPAPPGRYRITFGTAEKTIEIR